MHVWQVLLQTFCLSASTPEHIRSTSTALGLLAIKSSTWPSLQPNIISGKLVVKTLAQLCKFIFHLAEFPPSSPGFPLQDVGVVTSSACAVLPVTREAVMLVVTVSVSRQ